MAEKNRTAMRISLIAIMTAIVAVFTLVIRIPSPIGGYISLCDAAVTFASYAFGPVTGFIAGGLGTAFADLIGGYPQWALISFIVHGFEAFIIGLMVKNGTSSGTIKSIVSILIGTVMAVLAIALGGYIFSSLFADGSFIKEGSEHAALTIALSLIVLSIFLGFLLKGRDSVIAGVIAVVLAVIIVSLGYLTLTTLFGLTVVSEALLEVPGNIAQSSVGAVIGLILYSAVRKGFRNLDTLRW